MGDISQVRAYGKLAKQRAGPAFKANRTTGLEMNYLPQVTQAKRVRGFVIATRFDDGTEKHIDISQWFHGPVFKPLKDSSFFRKFFIEGGTLAWPNGVDIAPETLYQAQDVRKRARPNKA